jgi:hypothetical protein
MFMTLTNGNRSARVQGLDRPTARVEMISGTVVIIVVPGHSYSIGNRNSLIGQGYAPAAREVWTITQRDGDSLVVEQIARYSIRASSGAK